MCLLYGCSDMWRGSVCLLSSQRGRLCQLLSYSLPAPVAAFHTQLPNGSREYISTLPAGSLLGSPPGGTRERCKAQGGKGACSLVPASWGFGSSSPPATLLHPGRSSSFPWSTWITSAVFPALTDPSSSQPPQKARPAAQPPLLRGLGFSSVGTPSKLLRFCNTISSLGPPPNPRTQGCFLQPLPLWYGNVLLPF